MLDAVAGRTPCICPVRREMVEKPLLLVAQGDGCWGGGARRLLFLKSVVILTLSRCNLFTFHMTLKFYGQFNVSRTNAGFIDLTKEKNNHRKAELDEKVI
jgi:hypothetical protein